MTVAELIELLKQMPQNAPVSVMDNDDGFLHEEIESVYYVPKDAIQRASVIIVV